MVPLSILILFSILTALVGFAFGMSLMEEQNNKRKEKPPKPPKECPLCGADLIFPMLPGINALGCYAPDEPYKYPLPCPCKFAPKKPKEINSIGAQAVTRMAEKLMKACKEIEKNYMITTKPLPKGYIIIC